MMAHQKTVELVEVEHKHDPVLCPKCGEKALKTAYPVKPMPDPPDLTGLFCTEWKEREST